ncbi:MAG: NAD(P)-dependent oxidoreductase [Candidatus Aenigmatarchaeota archaeon]
MKVFITGIGGVLGSTLANALLKDGHQVKGNDILRIEEAWKLEGIKKDIDYLWKSSIDLETKDINGSDVVIDCALGSADRPFGIDSPTQVVIGNILPPLKVLETIRKLENRPVVIYTSSFNIFYGHKPTTITEQLQPLSSSVYGWSKAAAEHLYQSYNKAYDIPTIITRVGSAFGPKMRSDELVGRLIIYALKNKEFYLRSPEAKRLWCFAQDVVEFYKKIIKNAPDHAGKVYHCAGNKKNEVLTNVEIANRIKEFTGSEFKITPGHYEPGETVNGKPIDFDVNSEYTMKTIGWYPNHSVDEGLQKTIAWFQNNINRYSIQ